MEKVTCFRGFRTYREKSDLGEVEKIILWKLTVCSVSLSSFLMFAGTIVSSSSLRLSKWLMTAIASKSLVCVILSVSKDDFTYVIIDYVSAMVIMLALKVRSAYQYQDRSSAWIIAGIIVSFAASAIQESGIKLAENFNHNDLYHVVQMASLYLLYRGASLLKDF